MSEFSKARRDPLLDEKVYKSKFESYFKYVKDNEDAERIVNDTTKDRIQRTRISWSNTSKSLQHTILNYSAGSEFRIVGEATKESLEQFFRHKTLFPEKLLQYWEQDSYQYYLWLFSLAVMTGQLEKIADLVRWYSPDPDREGEDPLLASLMARLGIGMQNLPLASELTFPKSYAALYEAVQGDDSRPKEERQKCLQRYLKGWYQGMKECYWYGRHKGRFPTFFGYWAFEAGLVTLLYDLDDSSYRDMKYYPRDLVEHAREQGYDKALDPALMTDHQRHDILLPGAVTPYAARWKSNLLADEIMLEKGHILPGPERSEINPSHVHFWIGFRD